ncbi:ACP S-malonyltransferase [Actinokineospora spheciospongiae]|uniref:ACP S-malonyltransferase n=1 Tax=Actinokineospora spheciospongiae TaxID=909613 RepID=UPI000D9E8D50|nr:ACP S-malonyltransferase [Actinokineospora spheciospongiae]PWW59613.1 [acyl-carrier-protein] S-malonyltransferase [Actinokineospora spheciospongiae]
MGTNGSVANSPATVRTAVVFPGMAQAGFPVLGRFLTLDPFAGARVAEADDALGYSLLDRYWDDGGDYSVQAQVAFMVASTALADRAVTEGGLVPDVCAAPSFGHKAAVAFTGALPFGDAVRLTSALAVCEHEYFAERQGDLVTHSFVRVGVDEVADLRAELAEAGHETAPSGALDHDFHLLTLPRDGLDALKAAVSAVGGYNMQTMWPPVHAPVLRPLRERAERVLDGFALADPLLPVVSDVDGSLVTTADALRAMLLGTFDRPLDWPAAAAALAGLGVGTAWFPGPESPFTRVRCSRAFKLVKVDPKGALRAVLGDPAAVSGSGRSR